MSSLSELYVYLKEAAARKVSSAFETFLSEEINIPKGIRATASDSQNHLREFLSDEIDRDETFPRVLSINDDEFLGGSFARHTKIWPLDDIDIYFPLDGHSLVYWEQGIIQPYTVVSDGVLENNPLLTPRWMKGTCISSEKLITEFAKVLNRHYPVETKIKKDGQAVNVRMSYGESDASDGLGFDVVPCFSMKPQNITELPFYLIPSGYDGWIRTNPRVDTQIAERLHRDNNKTYRKVVKLLKYWNENKISGALNSYYIELAISKIYLQKNENNEYIKNVSYGVALGFWAVRDALSKGNQQAFIPKAPPVKSGDVQPYHSRLLDIGRQRANEAWDFEKGGKEKEALSKWKEIFGDNFPESE